MSLALNKQLWWSSDCGFGFQTVDIMVIELLAPYVKIVGNYISVTRYVD